MNVVLVFSLLSERSKTRLLYFFIYLLIIIKTICFPNGFFTNNVFLKTQLIKTLPKIIKKKQIILVVFNIFIFLKRSFYYKYPEKLYFVEKLFC